jgi:glycosyltransferase 2 family protein
MWRSWRFWAGVAITVILVWFALRGQDFGEMRDAFRRFDYRYVAPAVLLYFIGVWFRAVRWRILLTPVVNISTRSVLPVVVIGFMANNVLPFRAGELARAYALSKKTGARKTSALATIAVERLFDGITMLGFILGAATVVSLTSDLRHVALIAFIVFSLAILMLTLLTVGGDFRDRLIQIVLGPLPTPLADRVERVAESFLMGLGVLRRRRDLAMVAICSVLAWSFEASMYWMIARGFDQPLPETMTVAATALTTGVANLATLIPSSPGYVGAFETGVLLVVEGAFGVNGALALSYAFLVHAALFFPVTIAGLIVAWRERLSLRAIRDADETFEATEPVV